MNRLLPIVIGMAMCCAPPAFSQGVALSSTPQYKSGKSLDLKQTFGTKSDWNVTAFVSGEKGDDTDKTLPCKITFWKKGDRSKDLTVLMKSALPDASMTYNHQILEELSIKNIAPQQKAVVAAATFSAGGSGSTTRAVAWTYSRDNDEFSQVGAFDFTNQGECKFIDNGPLAGCVAVADAFWGDGESHFEPHLFTIQLYKYQKKSAHYAKILEYITDKKYPSLDAGAINVVTPETAKIVKNLNAVYTPKWLADFGK